MFEGGKKLTDGKIINRVFEPHWDFDETNEKAVIVFVSRLTTVDDKVHTRWKIGKSINASLSRRLLCKCIATPKWRVIADANRTCWNQLFWKHTRQHSNRQHCDFESEPLLCPSLGGIHNWNLLKIRNQRRDVEKPSFFGQ